MQDRNGGYNFMVKQINEEQFDELINGEKPVVCDFFATWCGPCKMLAPVIDEVATEFSPKVKFVKVDVDKEIALAARYDVRSIPMVIIFKKGEVVAKTLGFSPKEEFTEFVTRNV
jgi:thioredoxin 1